MRRVLVVLAALAFGVSATLAQGTLPEPAAPPLSPETPPPAPILESVPPDIERTQPGTQLTLEGLAKALDSLKGNLTVSTGDENFKLLIFGAIQGNMTFSTSRPVAPGAIFLLAPDSQFGLSTQTVDVHAPQQHRGGVPGPHGVRLPDRRLADGGAFRQRDHRGPLRPAADPGVGRDQE